MQPVITLSRTLCSSTQSNTTRIETRLEMLELTWQARFQHPIQYNKD